MTAGSLASLCHTSSWRSLMTFLHDDALAAMPFAVLTALFQLGGSFLFLCVVPRLSRRGRRRIVRAGALAASTAYFKTYLLALRCLAGRLSSGPRSS